VHVPPFARSLTNQATGAALMFWIIFHEIRIEKDLIYFLKRDILLYHLLVRMNSDSDRALKSLLP